jgi:hypothetical protein
MKPPQWVIDDMRAMRKIANRSPAQDMYLSLLGWYVKLIQGKD